MKPKAGTYVSDYMGHELHIPATIVGALAVHRVGGSPKARWTVSHVATKCHVEKGMPARFFGHAGTVTASKRELVEWAAAWQLAAPEFFKNMEERPPAQDYRGVVHRLNNTLELAQAAVTAGRAL